MWEQTTHLNIAAMTSQVRDMTPIQILGTVTAFRNPLKSKYVNAGEQKSIEMSHAEH